MLVTGGFASNSRLWKLDEHIVTRIWTPVTMTIGYGDPADSGSCDGDDARVPVATSTRKPEALTGPTVRPGRRRGPGGPMIRAGEMCRTHWQAGFMVQVRMQHVLVARADHAARSPAETRSARDVSYFFSSIARTLARDMAQP